MGFEAADDGARVAWRRSSPWQLCLRAERDLPWERLVVHGGTEEQGARLLARRSAHQEPFERALVVEFHSGAQFGCDRISSAGIEFKRAVAFPALLFTVPIVFEIDVQRTTQR